MDISDEDVVKPIERKKSRDESSKKDKKDKKDRKDKKDKKDKKEKSKKRESESGESVEVKTKKSKSLEASDSVKPSTAVASSSNGLVSGRKHPSNTKDRLTPAAFREKSNVTIDDEDSLYDPIQDFSELDFDQSLLCGIKTFNKPTPIQSQCWPIILAKRDVIGIAETGSGKTMGFSLPVLYHLRGNTNQRNPSVLILSPTRELATQTADVCTAAGADSGIRVLCVYGGVEKRPQIQSLKSGIDIIVATPGRLIDLLNDKCTTLSDVKFLVLDEADRMLDMGFEKDIRAIADQIPSDRQTLMFSATWPELVRKIAAQYLKNPIKVTIGSLDLSANRKVTQIVEVIDGKARDARLRELLQKYHGSGKNKVIVFVLYKKEATRVEDMLRQRGFNVQGIHADKTQKDRTLALDSFKNGKCPLLVATDVAARGLDVPDVEYVINYAFPLTIEDYVHRIGRTGRAGKTGVAHTFFTTFDKAHSGELVQILKEAKQEVPADLMKFGTAIKVKEQKQTGSIDINMVAGLSFDSDSD